MKKYSDKASMTKKEIRSVKKRSKLAEAQIYYKCGLEHFNQADYEEAIGDFTKAMDIEPKFSYAYLFRGFAYKILGYDKKAMEDFDHADEINKGIENSEAIDAECVIAYKNLKLANQEKEIISHDTPNIEDNDAGHSDELEEENDQWIEEEEENYQQVKDEIRLINEELDEESENYERSKDDGWYYSDDDEDIYNQDKNKDIGLYYPDEDDEDDK